MSSETRARNYKLEALTGLWAGDVNGKPDRLVTTSLLGSILSSFGFSYALGHVRSASKSEIMAPATQMRRIKVTPNPIPIEAPILSASLIDVPISLLPGHAKQPSRQRPAAGRLSGSFPNG